MNLFTPEQEAKLLENGISKELDHEPVVKLYIPDTGCVWLISELSNMDSNYAYGLSDLGLGYPGIYTHLINKSA